MTTILDIGSVIYTAVKPIFKIYLIIGSGFLLARMNILTVEVTRNLSDMIVTFILPCLTFNKIVGSISISDLKSIGVICLSAAILYSLGAFCSLLTILATPVPKKWRGGCFAGGIFPNISDLPIAYIQTLDTGLIFTSAQGNKGVAYVCIFLATFLFCQFNIGGFRLIEYDFIHGDGDAEKNNHANDDSETSRTPSMAARSTQNLNYREKEDADNEIGLTNNDDISVVTSLSSSAADNSDVEEAVNEQYVPTVNVTDVNQQERVASLNDDKSLGRASTHNHGLIRMASALTKLTTNSSGFTRDYNQSLSHVQSRALELRTLPSQNVRHVIDEYSRANNQPVINRMSTLTRIATTQLGASSRQDIKTAGSSSPFVEKYNLHFLVFILQNFLRPCSVVLMISLAVALIPWLKALFTVTPRVPNMPNAPDELPPLSFIMDYTAYVGQASVPLGLLMLGTTLFRLDLSGLNPKFLISAACLVVLKLCVVPIVGVSWASKLRELGWLNDSMIFFVICITFSLPSATTQFYFTASYTDPDAEDTTQMDCLSVYLLMEYCLLAVSLPFVVTYVIMKQL
ncbi:putative ATPase [Saccharomycopsis crataegensis]|uniref:ATPase n=1 Tax=Saccharomycopsis crataegensis TaxID=43959 RepID=A0AAV5QL09_9ASCO|nr:putative ATPase [Saccharomycopsis crataegensis]